MTIAYAINGTPQSMTDLEKQFAQIVSLMAESIPDFSSTL
jgi:hypothetical protein